jgi:hypothetical protein
VIARLTSDLASAVNSITDLGDKRKFLGGIVKLTEAEKGNLTSSSEGLDEALQRNLALFTTTNSTDLFSQRFIGKAGPPLPGNASARSDKSGALTRGRLKPVIERRAFLNSKPVQGHCSFCQCPGHQIGKRCQLYAGLNAEMLKPDTAKGDFKLSLGDASRHLVERPSLALRRDVFANADWRGINIPGTACHVLVKAVFFSEAYMSQLLIPRSRFAVQQPIAGIPPSQQDTIVELIPLDVRGVCIEGAPKFYLVNTVQAWIDKHVSSSSKERVLTQLKPAAFQSESPWTT